MLKTILILVLLSLFLSGAFASETKSLKQPVENSAEVTALIEEGIALHNARKYDEAISKYCQPIDMTPHEPLAL